MPVPLKELTRVCSCEAAHKQDKRGGCCATKKLSSHASEYMLCGSTCEDGQSFCGVHRGFMVTNPSRMVLPDECAGFRFGVGHEVFGLMCAVTASSIARSVTPPGLPYRTRYTARSFSALPLLVGAVTPCSGAWCWGP
jgi:hypothetical protein